jgi:hypothetical protein
MGMTMQFPVADQTQVNAPWFYSAADWISPGYDDEIFTEGGTRRRRAVRGRAGMRTRRQTTARRS